MQLVIAAITTRPWSSSVSVPSSSVTGTRLSERGSAVAVPCPACRGLPASSLCSSPGGSEAGNEPATASSWWSPLPNSSAAAGSNSRSDSMNAAFASVSAIRSCGPLRPGDRRLDAREIELDHIGEGRLLRVRLVEHALLTRVGVDQLDQLGGTPRELEVAQRLLVDREDRAGRPELGRHVPDRRPVGEAERVEARAEELDELADDAALAEHLGHAQDQVGGRRALGQLAAELEAEHLRQEHRDRLAQHRGLGLDPADAPTQDAKPVDHRRVRVGADERVGIGLRDAVGLMAEHHLAQVLEVHLVADAGCRRHHAEVVERLLAPAQEGVALLVSLVVAVRVDLERALVAERVHLDRVVDDQVDGNERVDLRRIAAEVVHRVAHRRQVDHRGHAREVLHEDSGGLERDLLRGLGLGIPGGDRLDVVAGDGLAVLEPQRVLEQHLQRIRKPGDVELLLERSRGGGSRTRGPIRRGLPSLRSCRSYPTSIPNPLLQPIVERAGIEGAASASRSGCPRPSRRP